MVRFRVDTPLPTGRMRVAVSARGVLWAAFRDRDTESMPAGVDLAAAQVASDRRAVLVTRRLADYFAGRWRAPAFGLPIDWSLTTGLQRRVLYRLAQDVPFGETVTYGKLAERSGAFDPDAARSGQAARIVGTIMSTCPIAILIPAHRVIAADGLGGFGTEPDALPTKRWLLTLEGALAPTLDWDGPS